MSGFFLNIYCGCCPSLSEQFFILVFVNQFKRLGRAHINTDGDLHVEAEITFQGNFPLGPGINNPVRAEQRTGPAADAIIFLNNNNSGLFVTRERTRQAGVKTRSLATLSALQSNRYLIAPFHPNPGLRKRAFLHRLEQGFGITPSLSGTIELTTLTAGTAIEMNGNNFHKPLLCN